MKISLATLFLLIVPMFVMGYADITHDIIAKSPPFFGKYSTKFAARAEPITVKKGEQFIISIPLYQDALFPWKLLSKELEYMNPSLPLKLIRKSGLKATNNHQKDLKVVQYWIFQATNTGMYELHFSGPSYMFNTMEWELASPLLLNVTVR